MNDKLKAILEVAGATASVAFPGAAPAIAVGQHILNQPGSVKDPTTTLDAVQAGIQTIENYKGIDIANEVKFRAGCAVMLQGFQMVHEALTDHTDGTPKAAA